MEDKQHPKEVSQKEKSKREAWDGLKHLHFEPRNPSLYGLELEREANKPSEDGRTSNNTMSASR